MSLINDALKKAQRQRTNNPFGVDAPMPGGGGRVARGGSGMPKQTMLLVVAGCVLLAVVSGVGAVMWVNRKSEPKPATVPVASTPAAAPASAPAAPAGRPIELPSLPAPAPITLKADPAPVAPAAIAETKSETASAAASPAGTATASKAAATETKSTPAPAPTPAASARPAVPDERIHAFLDALRVTGVRAAGAGSRVLLNEKVYRIGDLVERSLGVKLSGVETDFLTFTDANGLEYRRNF